MATQFLENESRIIGDPRKQVIHYSKVLNEAGDLNMEWKKIDELIKEKPGLTMNQINTKLGLAISTTRKRILNMGELGSIILVDGKKLPISVQGRTGYYVFPKTFLNGDDPQDINREKVFGAIKDRRKEVPRNNKGPRK